MNEDELQEKLKNMSPEELAAFQKQNCVFCQIIEGKIDSKKIYEDEFCLGIFDISPARPGHVLLLPKEHYMLGPQVPKNVMAHLAKVAKHISHCMLNTLKSEGTSFFVANGPAAGQMSQHFMMHVIPSEDVVFSLPEHEAKDLEKIAKPLREYINKKLGINTQNQPEEVEQEPQEIIEPQRPKKEKGYLYFVDRGGDISRAKMVKGRKKEKQKKEKVLKVGITRQPGLLYYVDKNLEIKSARMNRSGRKKSKRKKKAIKVVKNSKKVKRRVTTKNRKVKRKTANKTIKKKKKATQKKIVPKKEKKEEKKVEKKESKQEEKVTLDDISRLFT